MVSERIVSEKATVLCVDDEPGILSALTRFLRRERYDVLTAESGAAGLDLLRRHVVDVVISDMRMPEMDGAQFLAEVARNWPETVRIMLTGYADISATIDAINQGEIFRYVSKPWDEDELRQTVRSSMEKVYLEQVRRDMEKATRHTAVSVADLNSDAEQELRARNQQLQHRVDQLELERLQRRRDFGDTVRVLANLAECVAGNRSGHSRQVADLARDIAEHLQLPMPQIETVHLAALLHEAGETLGAQAPASGEHDLDKATTLTNLLMLGPAVLRTPAKLVAAYQRLTAGRPPGDEGNEFMIVGARILSAAHQAQTFLESIPVAAKKLPGEHDWGQSRAPGLSEDVIAATSAVVAQRMESPVETGAQEIRSPDFLSGMVLSHDLVSPEGFIALTSDSILDSGTIETIRAYERAWDCSLTAQIYARPGHT